MQAITLSRNFARFVLPSIYGMIGLSCYILADTYFIALGMGTRGLAALNIAIPVYSVMHGLGLMLGVGGATRFAVCHAQREKAKGNGFFSSALRLALGLGIVFALLGNFFAAPLTALLGADGDTAALTQTYVRTLLTFAPFFLANNVLLAFTRNDGAPRLAMLGMLLGSLFNIVFDYIFIFPLGLGIFGAALATGISPIVSLLVLSAHWRSDARSFHMARGSRAPASALCAPGLSALVGELSSGFVLLAYNLVILGLQGNTGVAAYGVVANLAIVALSIFTGIGQGAQPLISARYGANDRPSLSRLFRYGAVLALGIAAALYLLVTLFAPPLVAAFNSEGDRALAALAVPGLRTYFSGFLFAGCNIVICAFFSAAGRARTGFVLSLLRGLALVIPVLLVLSALLGMDGVWLAFPVTEAATLLCALWCAARGNRKAFVQA